MVSKRILSSVLKVVEDVEKEVEDSVSMESELEREIDTGDNNELDDVEMNKRSELLGISELLRRVEDDARMSRESELVLDGSISVVKVVVSILEDRLSDSIKLEDSDEIVEVDMEFEEIKLDTEK